MVGVCEDVTAEKEAERATAELASLVRVLGRRDRRLHARGDDHELEPGGDRSSTAGSPRR